MQHELKKEIKICKVCGRELPQNKFFKIYGKCWTVTCLDCREQTRRKHCLEKGMELYQSGGDLIKIKRSFKNIYPSQVLKESDSRINPINEDEIFVRLLDYKDTWVSNYGRAAVKSKSEYRLLKGSYSRATKELYYKLDRNVYREDKKTWGYKKQKVNACDLVIKTFIVNYDIINNTCCWHTDGNRKDNYYKHLYPVTDKQYAAIHLLCEETGEVTEEQIISIMNAAEYKPDDWNPWYYRRSYEGVGYLGASGVDYLSDAYSKWVNMIQRCYNSKIHVVKPYYKDVRVCEEWHNFQNFKVWYGEHYVQGAKLELDKDLVCKDSNMYSPETCSLITHYMNTIFEERGIKCSIAESNGMYKVSFSILGKMIDVGTFDTETDAVQAFVDYKKKYIIEIAEKSKHKVQDYIYQAMLDWKVLDVV